MGTKRARLDADRKAKPKTRIVARVPKDKEIVGHHLVQEYELKDNEDEEDQRNRWLQSLSVYGD